MYNQDLPATALSASNGVRLNLMLLLVTLTNPVRAEEYRVHSFETTRLSEHFWSEGAHIADIDQDGQADVVAGPYWYRGPAFLQRTEFYPASSTFELKKTNGQSVRVSGYEGGLGVSNAYSANFLNFSYDFNQDKWPDVLVIGFPGEPAVWYENPQGKPGHWAPHVVFDVVDNESPWFTDITGDGIPDLICGTTVKTADGPRGLLGYVTLHPTDPTAKGTFHPISPTGSWQRYTHGLGVGDVNGDGRADYLEAGGWWEQPAQLAGDPLWKRHPVAFGSGGAQMHVDDVNGDGLNDVITSLEAHNYGLCWFEQQQAGAGETTFVQHTILGRSPEESPYGLLFTQMHAIDLVDMDHDGLKDIVTGKRYWAHGPGGDADSEGPALLYWFRLTRTAAGKVEYVPQFIDDDSGVGTQVMAADVDADGWHDVIVANKKGTFVHRHVTTPATQEEWQNSQPPVRFPAAAKP